jgi:hypothetical protein
MSYEIPNELVKFRVETIKGEDVLIFDHDASLMDREVARQIYEADKPKRDALDAARWRFFDDHAQDIVEGSSLAAWLKFDGPMKHGSRAAAIDFLIAAEKESEK